MTLSELIKALEAAQGPSREFDDAIMAMFYDRREQHIGGYYDDGSKALDTVWIDRKTDKWVSTHAHSFTSSVDAAIALCERVLPGYGWDLASNTQHILNCLNSEYGKPIGKHPHWAAVANTSSRNFEDGATPGDRSLHRHPSRPSISGGRP